MSSTVGRALASALFIAFGAASASAQSPDDDDEEEDDDEHAPARTRAMASTETEVDPQIDGTARVLGAVRRTSPFVVDGGLDDAWVARTQEHSLWSPWPKDSRSR